jgi:hypothetical protein
MTQLPTLTLLKLNDQQLYQSIAMHTKAKTTHACGTT